MAKGFPADLLGLFVAGDLGDTTIYTDRHGRKITFPRSPPTKPPTDMQAALRARFATAVANWKALSTPTKRDWENMSLRANVCMTGHNIWVSISLTHELGILATLIRQTGIQVDAPPLV